MHAVDVLIALTVVSENRSLETVGFRKLSFPNLYSVQANSHAPGEIGENKTVGYGNRFQGELPEGSVIKTFTDLRIVTLFYCHTVKCQFHHSGLQQTSLMISKDLKSRHVLYVLACQSK
jgi:hypothetical protein